MSLPEKKIRELAAFHLEGFQHATHRGGYVFLDEVDGLLGFACRPAPFYLNLEQEAELLQVLTERARTRAGSPPGDGPKRLDR